MEWIFDLRFDLLQSRKFSVGLEEILFRQSFDQMEQEASPRRNLSSNQGVWVFLQKFYNPDFAFVKVESMSKN